MTLRLAGIDDVETRRANEREFSQKIGARLRKWRVSAGLSLVDLADKVGVVDTQIMRYETGFTPIKCVTAARIAQVLGHELIELLK